LAPRGLGVRIAGGRCYHATRPRGLALTPRTSWRWRRDCAGAIDTLVELLQGRFSKAVTARICQEKMELFPGADRDRVLMQRPEMGLDVQARSIRARPHTERKRAEKERERLRQAQADLAHISRVITMGLWTPSLVHEIRQPIGAAINTANACLRWLARERPDLEAAPEAAARMVNDAERTAEMIRSGGLAVQKGHPATRVAGRQRSCSRDARAAGGARPTGTPSRSAPI